MKRIYEANHKKTVSYLTVALLYLLTLSGDGGIYPQTTGVLLVFSLVWLYLIGKRRKCICFWSGMAAWGIVLILIGAVISEFTGTDRGDRIWGVVRLVTVLTVSFCLKQLEEKERSFYLESVPYMGIVLIFAGIILRFLAWGRDGFFGGNFPQMGEGWIANTGRFAGPFSYPNAMALFLIIGVIIAEQFSGKKKWIIQIVLYLGIFWTGSRTAFVIFAGYLLLEIFRRGRKSYMLLLIFGILALSIALANALGVRSPAMGRFLTISLEESTIQGRLLYWEDACRMILKYPFGLGYMGYFYLQQAMQTGVYSVRFVHNEWLQLILDYGILAGVGAVLCCSSYFGKMKQSCKGNTSELTRTKTWKKDSAGMILVYSFFDFHLQFWGILFWLLMLMSDSESRHSDKAKCLDGAVERNLKSRMTKSASFQRIQFAVLAGAVFAAVIALVCQIAGYYAKRGVYDMAVRWNPLSTEYRLKRLLNSSDLTEADILADDVLECNEYVYAAYKIKSNAAAQNGDVQAFIDNRKEVLQLRKYDAKEYEEYFRILYSLYTDACIEEDEDKMQQCIGAMEEIETIINDVKRNTSVRAFRIDDKPQLYLRKEYQELIHMMKGEENE